MAVARSWWQRARGLLFRPPPRRGEGLLFTRCRSVHTWLMKYPIDVVYIDNAGVVTKIAAGLRPWRFSAGGRGARHALELSAGESLRLNLQRGQKLDLDSGGMEGWR